MPRINKDFKFKNVPSPVKEHAASKAKLTLVDGEMDPNGANLSALTDGLPPDDEDQPPANFFFNAGTMGGRFSMDLGGAIRLPKPTPTPVIRTLTDRRSISLCQ